MTLNKYIYALIMVFNISCQGQENKSSNIEKKEMEIFSKILNKSQFQNPEENFENINKELLGINTRNLEEGYNEINIFNEAIDYQISKEGKYIKIGDDVLPDIDKINEENLITYPYMKSVVNLNKIIYQNDLTSILTTTHSDVDLARDIVILFNYEKNEILLKKISNNIQDLKDYTNNFILSIVFYNKDHTIRKKLLEYLSKNQELISHITFYLADNKKEIVNKNKLLSKDIDGAIAFLLNLGLQGRENDDIYTGNDFSYGLLNNIFISYPNLIEEFGKNNYFGYDALKYFTKVFQTEQEHINESDSIEVYVIEDPDGYTNLRKEKSAQSEILQKIKTGEQIEVLDNTGDWFLVKTKEGKTGYVHKSRVKSGNSSSHSTTYKLYDRPDFSSFSREVIAKDEIETVHNIEGWDFVKIDGVTGYLPTEEAKEQQKTTENRKYTFLAEEDEIKPEKKKGFGDNLFG
ncbi:SH3 domain-containing protein [Chryseobacterium sp.]|jgi:hypothetical protein|uniref:SH3 domain-containing protein n=1 Tax=Chryseobacterium sp. TaxID=1871047 RepID=UPI00283B4003|nr:SH3 domain-containing protein [Chryseobacterium sp.]MDR3025140.1 SH3 domain-containing protein [Chryseobacterium sp.]